MNLFPPIYPTLEEEEGLRPLFPQNKGKFGEAQ
jgi:hypothetical protein